MKINEYGFFKSNSFANRFNKNQHYDLIRFFNNGEGIKHNDIYRIEKNENGKYVATCGIWIESSDPRYYEIATHEEISEFSGSLSHRIDQKWENIIVAYIGEFNNNKDAMIYIDNLLKNRM